MKIKGLFKGKYLIAVYDMYENLRCVADTPRKVANFLGIKVKTVWEQIDRGEYDLIDVTQIHNDCFMEEDIEFLIEILYFKGVEVDDKKDRRNCQRGFEKQ